MPLLIADTTGVLEAKTLIELLQEKHPGQFEAGQVRTLQRRMDTVGVAKDHLIGIRSLVVNSKYTADLQGCGDVPDGSNDGMGKVTGNSMITHIEGKRCWINKVIHGDAGATAINLRPAAQRHVFAAGDSDTDVEFLKR